MPEPGSRFAAVVLAAGASRRLGQPKQLVRVGGETLLRRTARLATEAGCCPVVVTLGFEAERMRTELAGMAVHAVVNPNWQAGMGSSLACGVRAAVTQRPEVDGLLVLVCDQPRLTGYHLRQLLERQTEDTAAITASGYAGRLGVPAVFAASLIPELEQMDGDRGAREVLARHHAQAVPWPEGAFDIDLPEDLSLVRLHPGADQEVGR
jgi:molybdenum cofactor cytidylyltransferase